MNTDNENPENTTEQPRPGRRTAAVGAIVLGLLVAGGIGAAIAVGVSNDDDVVGLANRAPAPADPSAVPTPGDADATDIDGMLAAMAQARATVPGKVVEVKLRSSGVWEIEIFDGANRESTVLIDDDGPRVIDTDEDDDYQNIGEGLTDELVRQIVSVATADTAGVVIKIELDDDDDDDDLYSVKVQRADGAVIELDLNRNLDITDRDHD